MAFRISIGVLYPSLAQTKTVNIKVARAKSDHERHDTETAAATDGIENIYP
jgi:hypothetical protein